MTKAAMSGVLVAMHTGGAAVANGLVLAIPPSIIKHTIYIKGIDAPSAGAIQIESADSPDYAGTWGQIGGGPVTIVDGELAINFEGVYSFIRARISTEVTSGTVNVNYLGAH